MLRLAIDYLSNLCNREVNKADLGWDIEIGNDKIVYTKYGGMRVEYFEEHNDPFIVAMRDGEVLPILTIRPFNPNRRLLDYLRKTSSFWDTKQGDTVFIYPKIDKISVF